MNIEQRIRQKATEKVCVAITLRRRAATGFVVSGPDGEQNFRTKKEALENLFARLRCSDFQRWSLSVGK
jgi:hypothetical protein